MAQMTLSTKDRMDCIYPHGVRCKYLKTTPTTGMEVPDHNGSTVMIMGYCRRLGGDAYNGSCKGCGSYEPKDDARRARWPSMRSSPPWRRTS